MSLSCRKVILVLFLLAASGSIGLLLWYVRSASSLPFEFEHNKGDFAYGSIKLTINKILLNQTSTEKQLNSHHYLELSPIVNKTSLSTSFTNPNSSTTDSSHLSEPPTSSSFAAVCHKTENNDPVPPTGRKIIVMGATSFIGASIVRVLHHVLSVSVIASEDNVNIGFDSLAWYRWEKLIGMGVDPQYMNYGSHSKTESFIKKHSPSSIVYVPTPLFEGEGSKRDIRQITELHEDFLLLLEIIRKVSPTTSVILVSISDPKDSYTSLIKLFELSLSVYNRLYGTRIAIVRTEGVYGPWQESSNSTKICYVDDLVTQIKRDLIDKPIHCTVKQSTDFVTNPSNKGSSVMLTEKWTMEYQTLLKHTQTKGVIASTYITTRRNAQYSIEFNNNNYYFMENWFKNIYKMNLDIAVFHDALSDHFVSTFKKNYQKSDFIKIRDFKSLSPNDERFYSYYKYILEHPEIDYFVMTDMRDVIIQNNPFEVMKVVGEDLVYIGIDEPTRYLPKYSYLPNLFSRCFFRNKLNYQKELGELGFFNAGAIGGRRGVVLAFLTRFFQYLEMSSKQNCNMGVVEYIFHRYFYDDLVYGWPFNAAFLTHQPNVPGLAILHKWSMDSFN